MKLSAIVSLPYSIFLIMDNENRIIPTTFSGSIIAATDSCIAVSTLMQYDGETILWFADEEDAHITSIGRIAFDGKLDVAGNEVSIFSAFNVPILSLPVSKDLIRVRVWANHAAQPDCIGIVID